MTELYVQLDPAQLAAYQRDLAGVKGGIDGACRRAINRTATTLRARLVRAIAEQIMVPPGELRSRNVRLLQANYSQLEARITISGGRIPLILFGARPGRMSPAMQRRLAGTSYQIATAGGRRTAEGAFTAELRAGARAGVYRRIGTGRFPVRQLRGPSVPHVALDVLEEAAGEIQETAENELERNLSEQVGILLRRQ